MDVGLGAPFRDSECWRTSKENGRDAGERLERDKDVEGQRDGPVSKERV